MNTHTSDAGPSALISLRLKKAMVPLLVIAVGIATYALLQISKPEPDKKDNLARPLSVFVEPVQQADVTLNVSTQGEVRARTDIDIVSEVSGRIVAVSPEFTEGGRIEKGSTLVSIEDADHKLALTQAEVRVAEAEVRLQQALATADVAGKQLRNNANPSALALKKPQVAEAHARLKASKADLQQAKLTLSRTLISLPFNGRIFDTLVNVGQYVTTGTRLGRAFATDVVEVRLALTDSQLSSLDLPIGYIASDGEGRKVRLSARVAGREHLWTGRLVRLDASIDSSTRMLYGVVEVLDPYGLNVSRYGMPLAVGLFVNAAIEGREVEAAHLIPREALRAGHKVFVIDESGHLEVREVDVLHSSSKEVIISAGLSQGEDVIVSSIRNPVKGMALTAMQQESALKDSIQIKTISEEALAEGSMAFEEDGEARSTEPSSESSKKDEG